MKKTVFIYSGPAFLVDYLGGSEAVEGRLTPQSTEEDAIRIAQDYILASLDIAFGFDLSVTKVTFRRGASEKEIEDIIDGIIEELHGQDTCTFIIEE